MRLLIALFFVGLIISYELNYISVDPIIINHYVFHTTNMRLRLIIVQSSNPLKSNTPRVLMFVLIQNITYDMTNMLI